MYLVFDFEINHPRSYLKRLICCLIHLKGRGCSCKIIESFSCVYGAFPLCYIYETNSKRKNPPRFCPSNKRKKRKEITCNYPIPRLHYTYENKN